MLEQKIELDRAEEPLHSNERSLSLIIDTIPTSVWSARPDGYCDFLNQRWLDYAGMTASQLLVGNGAKQFTLTTARGCSRRKFATELKHTPLKDLCYLGGWKEPQTEAPPGVRSPSGATVSEHGPG